MLAEAEVDYLAQQRVRRAIFEKAVSRRRIEIKRLANEVSGPKRGRKTFQLLLGYGSRLAVMFDQVP